MYSIDTYVERDVRQIINIREEKRFQQFVRLCAGNIGQLLNASRLGSDCGVNHGTVSNWLSVMNVSYITFQLHPLRGALFENWVIVELFKARLNMGLNSNLFFWRNNAGLEVDVIIDKGDCLVPVEIKSGATLSSKWFSSVEKWLSLAGDDAKNVFVIYGGDKSFEQSGISVLSWRNTSGIIKDKSNDSP